MYGLGHSPVLPAAVARHAVYVPSSCTLGLHGKTSSRERLKKQKHKNKYCCCFLNYSVLSKSIGLSRLIPEMMCNGHFIKHLFIVPVLQRRYNRKAYWSFTAHSMTTGKPSIGVKRSLKTTDGAPRPLNVETIETEEPLL